MCGKGGSIPTERIMCCHMPSGILNTPDEHEAHQDPFRGSMGFPRAVVIEAEGKEERGSIPVAEGRRKISVARGT